MNILVSQLSPRVGNFVHNVKIIKDAIDNAVSNKCKLVVTPEFSLCGYPPEDLLFRDEFYKSMAESMAALQSEVDRFEVFVLIGLPRKSTEGIYNSMALLGPNSEVKFCDKVALPNYGVFDERRYFTPGKGLSLIKIGASTFAVLICEDIWDDNVVEKLREVDVDGVISVNASPFDDRKSRKRYELVAKRCCELKLSILYLNMVSGQDELLFDGGSFAMDKDSNITMRAPLFDSAMICTNFNGKVYSGYIAPQPSDYEKIIIDALVYALREYCVKNNFQKVFIGLSGGIDSALVLTLAVLALGKESVCAVMMPTRYTSEMSLSDAKELATSLDVDYKILPIESLCSSYLDLLQPEFGSKNPDITEENIQARVRGVILMALANKFNGMVLATGNKSEIAVGYCTIYGDMAGGFALIKDVYKSTVFRLCKYITTDLCLNIPNRIIIRAPSAELRHDQQDADSLPAYDILDKILFYHIEGNSGENDIVKLGYSREVVKRVLKMVRVSEYKRKQAPIGPKLTERAFGKDWRLPISC